MSDTKKTSRYVKKGPKIYTQWIIEHKDEILNIPSKDRTHYVHEHLNNDLNLNKSRYEIYQLLYRNKLIDPLDHNKIAETKAEIEKKKEIKKEAVKKHNDYIYTLSDITDKLNHLTNSDFNPEFIQNITQKYLDILNKINEDFEDLNNFKNELNEII